MADYKAPDIGTLSAHEYNKIRTSFDKYRSTQGSYRDSPMYDPNQRGFRTQFEIAKEKAAAPRREFKKKNYGIEDEYRYMVSQGFRPESMQVAPQQQQAAAPVEEPETSVFTPEVLDRGKPGPGQSEQPQGPDFASLFADQISSMQQMFQQSMQQQQTQYMQMQQAQDERMAALQQQMQQSMVAQQQRPAVAGVQMAQGAGGTPMQIARRGVTGAFGRRGMRISSLNV
jgi:hypothetical protein